MAKLKIKEVTITEDMVATEEMKNAKNEAIRAISSGKPGREIAIAKLDKIVEQRNVELRHACYDQFLATEQPMATCVNKLTLFQFSLKKSRKEDKDGVMRVTDVDFTAKGKTVRINLSEFINYAKDKEMVVTTHKDGVDLDRSIEKLKYYLSVWGAESVGAELTGRFSYDPSGDEIIGAKKEVSKTAVKNVMQQVINSCMFVDDGKGKNALKPLTVDIEYMTLGAFGFSSKVQTLKCPSTKTVYDGFIDVMNRIMTGGRYSGKFDNVKKEEATK